MRRQSTAVKGFWQLAREICWVIILCLPFCCCVVVVVGFSQRITILSFKNTYLTWTLLPVHLEILGAAELSLGKFTMGTEGKFENLGGLDRW